MNKRFLLIFSIFVAIFVGLLVLNGRNANAPIEEATPSSHTVGAGSGGVTLVEYGDFECPACGSYYHVLKQVKAKYGDRITFQFRHFPLTQIHPNAMAAHRAAEAAGRQGKFFEMHDLLYERQANWRQAPQASSIFETYAQELGLDMVLYRADVASPTVNRVINADLQAGYAVGADSTPTFVLNDKKLEENPRDLEGFSELIDESLQADTSGETR